VTVILYGLRSLLENIKVENLQVKIVKSETGESFPRLNLSAELQGNVWIRKLKSNQ
jgi:hypothetical protein